MQRKTETPWMGLTTHSLWMEILMQNTAEHKPKRAKKPHRKTTKKVNILKR